MKSYLDFTPGTTFRTPRRTITEAHVVGFAGITGDFYPLHVDEVYAQGTPFGRRIVHGPLVYSTAVGLMFESGVYVDDVIIAFLGVRELRHLAPCFIGDTVHVEATVVSARPTKDGTRGVVAIQYNVIAVDDYRHLMQAELTFLMHGARSRVDAEASS